MSRALYVLQQLIRRRGFHLLPEFVNRLGEGCEFRGPGYRDIVGSVLINGVDNILDGKGIDITGRLIAESSILPGGGFRNYPALDEIIQDIVHKTNGNFEPRTDFDIG